MNATAQQGNVASSACNLIPDAVLAAQNISRQEIVSEVSELSSSIYGTSQNYLSNVCYLLTDGYRSKDEKKLSLRPKMVLLSYTKISASDAIRVMDALELYRYLMHNGINNTGLFFNNKKIYTWKGNKEACEYSNNGNISGCTGIRGEFLITVNYVVLSADDIEYKRTSAHNLLEKVSNEIQSSH